MSMDSESIQRQSSRQMAVFWLLLIFLNIPNFFWLSSPSDFIVSLAAFIERLFLSLILGSIFLGFFSRPRSAFLVIWLLFLWWQPLALGVRAINGTPITTTLIGMLAATSPGELHNLISMLHKGWTFYFFAWNIGCWMTWRTLYLTQKHQRWRWSLKFRGKVWLFSAAMLALPYFFMQHPESSATLQTDASLPSRAGNTETSYLFHSFSQVNQRIDFFTQLSDAFPFELPWAIAQYWQAQQVIQSVRARLPSPSHGLTIEQAKAEVVVLVIGESSTRNAWHWFNPQAPSTTPHLEARREKGEHIYGFNRVFSQTTSTRQSVPSILTNQPLIWPNGQVNSEATKSIIWTAGQAGYSTAWLSNQAAVGEHDGIIASYAQEAQRTAFLNPSSFSDQGSFDEVLLPALSDHLAKNKKSFIVLHTMGSHFQYKHRYPKNFGPFPNPKNFGNDYFNSIAYTDMLLDKILHILQGNDRKTALIYVADHGENIPQGNCEVEGFSRSSREAYEVPALVWLSQSYAQDHPEVAKLLQRHENQIHTISSIHQTLLDLMQANTISPLPNEDSPGFLRPWKPDKNSPLAVWMQEFEKATTANPCIIIFR